MLLITSRGELSINRGNNFTIYSHTGGHGVSLKSDERRTLKKDLEDKVALKIEASHDVLDSFRVGLPSVETLCWDAFEGRPREFIFEDQRGELLDRYGIPVDIAGRMIAGYVYFADPFLSQPPQHQRGALLISVTKEAQIYDGKINPRIATDAFVAEYLRAESEGKIQEYARATDVFCGFIGNIKEYERWMPGLIVFRRRYKGNIAIAIGNSHATFVKGLLEGRPIERPMDFSAFIKSLEPSLAEFYQSLS